MVIHVFADIAKKERRENGDRPECNAREVYVLIRLCKRDLACFDDGIVQDLVASDTGYMFDVFEQGSPCQLDDLGNSLLRGDTGGVQGPSNVFDGDWSELVDEYIVCSY